jgi:hypothetical protein
MQTPGRGIDVRLAREMSRSGIGGLRIRKPAVGRTRHRLWLTSP